LHEDDKKSLKSEEVWLSQEERNKKLDLAVFFIFMVKTQAKTLERILVRKYTSNLSAFFHN